MRNRNIITGAFVLAGIALFTLVIFLVGNQRKTFAKHVEFYTEFANIDGIMKGSKVRVGGFDAGEVTDIKLPDSPAAPLSSHIECCRAGSRFDQAGLASQRGIRGHCRR